MVQEIFLTKTAEIAHVVLPAAATWCEGEGTVTNSERRVQRVRKVVEPPGDARDELWIISEIAQRLGDDWGTPTAEEVWNEIPRGRAAFRGRHDLRASRGARRHPVAVPRRVAPGRDVPARPPVGRARGADRSHRSASCSTIRRRSSPTTSIR